LTELQRANADRVLIAIGDVGPLTMVGRFKGKVPAAA
jgi:hypothetical protein